MPHLVQDYFSDSARRRPDAIAVACKAETITYGTLDLASNALGRHLKHSGLSRGAFVPIFMSKGLNAIRSILGVLKADAAYVPLDIGSPAGRLAEIFDATSATHVLIDGASRQRFHESCGGFAGQVIDVDDLPEVSSAPIACDNISIDVAYTLFTSGSTGKPKGVMISHQMIVDYIDWCVDTYGLHEGDVIANHAPLYFDNSTFDLYTAFKTGAQLQLVHDELNLIMTKLVPWLRKRQVTCLFCVPSVLTILLKSGKLKPDSFPGLRHVIAAGEVLPPDVLRRWMQLYPHVQFTNMYGPTEITVDCTFHVLPELPAPDAETIPIGKARRNMEVFVRTDDGQLWSEPGREGEIVVRGAAVSYGYLGDRERTAATFVQNPRHDLYHDPLYLTGDLGRIADDGSLLFLGRRDQQIKYMGNRIELGEIEAKLLRLEMVREGVVVFNDSPNVEDKCIGALVCLRPGGGREAVAEALEHELPAYMVPRRIAVVDDIPRTPNGKADRRAAFALIFTEPQ